MQESGGGTWGMNSQDFVKNQKVSFKGSRHWPGPGSNYNLLYSTNLPPAVSLCGEGNNGFKVFLQPINSSLSI